MPFNAEDALDARAAIPKGSDNGKPRPSEGGGSRQGGSRQGGSRKPGK